MSQGLTPTNLIGNTLATIVVAKWENALDEERLHRMLDGGPAESALSSEGTKQPNSPVG
jgi:aerobic C4-dicarboxylate transport protein